MPFRLLLLIVAPLEILSPATEFTIFVLRASLILAVIVIVAQHYGYSRADHETLSREDWAPEQSISDASCGSHGLKRQ
jgi:hypothetical protein